MVKSSLVVVFALGVWMCGYLVQAQAELGGLFTQDMVPRESKTCKEIRYNLEMMLFSTYKGFIPRTLLKQVLPGLVEPLLPAECRLGGGHGKWLLGSPNPEDLVSNPTDGHNAAPSPVQGIFGDQPLLARRKKRSAEEDEDSDSEVAHIRHKRANGEEEKKGPNMDAFAFSPFLFGDVPDHRATATPMFPFAQSLFASLNQLFFPRRSSPFRQSRANAVRRTRYGPRPNVMYGNSPNYRRSNMFRQAPVFPALTPPPPPLVAPAAMPASSPLPAPTAPSLAPAPPPIIQSPANSVPAAQPNLVQPAPAQPPVAASAPVRTLPTGPSPLLTPSTSSFSRPVSLPVYRSVFPAQTQPRVSASTGGMIFGDRLPTYGSPSMTTSRRVKRASDNNSGPSDVVTFGDFSMPADTFHKLIEPRGSRYNSEDSNDYRGGYRPYYPPPPPPPPSRYNHVVRRPARYPLQRRTFFRRPAPIYGRGYPFASSPFARARQARLLNARRQAYALAANQVAARAHARAVPLAPPAAQYVPAAAAAGMMPPAGMSPTASMMAPTLPLGAAQPVHGTHPVY